MERLTDDRAKALFEAREVEVKGKGTMRTYLLDVLGKRDELRSLGLDLMADRELWGRIQSGEVHFKRK